MRKAHLIRHYLLVFQAFLFVQQVEPVNLLLHCRVAASIIKVPTPEPHLTIFRRQLRLHVVRLDVDDPLSFRADALWQRYLDNGALLKPLLG